eukprot:120604-Amorphochlora_amoeboformis.AAC.1
MADLQANSFLASKMRKSPSGKMRVLIVDDCVVPRKSLKRMIQKLDFPVECDMAKSGEEVKVDRSYPFTIVEIE